MQRIQEKVRARRGASVPRPARPVPESLDIPAWQAIDDVLTRAQATKLAQLRTSLTLQERRLDAIVDSPSKPSPGRDERHDPEASAADTERVSDATYLHFEDEFRGSREAIKERAAVYLPALRA